MSLLDMTASLGLDTVGAIILAIMVVSAAVTVGASTNNMAFGIIAIPLLGAGGLLSSLVAAPLNDLLDMDMHYERYLGLVVAASLGMTAAFLALVGLMSLMQGGGQDAQALLQPVSDDGAKDYPGQIRPDPVKQTISALRKRS
jgi:hypothetical protein